MKLLWLAATLLAASPAAAGEQSELIACFEELRPVSDGFGFSLGAWERWPPVLYPTVAVPSKRDGVEGFYLYTEDKAYFSDFSKVPREERTGTVRWFPFELAPVREGRGTFRCSFEAVDGNERTEIRCDFTDWQGRTMPAGRYSGAKPRENPFYYPAAARPIPPSSANHAALRTAVLSRIMSVTHQYSKEAGKYGKSLEAHKKRMAQGPAALTQAAGMIGLDLDWNRDAPVPPSKEAARRALAVCKGMSMTPDLAAAAGTESSLLDNFSLPR